MRCKPAFQSPRRGLKPLNSMTALRTVRRRKIWFQSPRRGLKPLNKSYPGTHIGWVLVSVPPKGIKASQPKWHWHATGTRRPVSVPPKGIKASQRNDRQIQVDVERWFQSPRRGLKPLNLYRAAEWCGQLTSFSPPEGD